MVKFLENDRDGQEKVRLVLKDFIPNAGSVIEARVQAVLCIIPLLSCAFLSTIH